MGWSRFVGLVSAGWVLACAGGAEERAQWYVNGEAADGARLHGAVMDLWGGDPGPICFRGDAQKAAALLEQAFAGGKDLSGVGVAGGQVTAETVSPFGGEEMQFVSFGPCPDQVRDASK